VQLPVRPEVYQVRGGWGAKPDVDEGEEDDEGDEDGAINGYDDECDQEQ
jgi:hypothetical protein